jgi:hypothetical protein
MTVPDFDVMQPKSLLYAGFVRNSKRLIRITTTIIKVLDPQDLEFLQWKTGSRIPAK